MSVIKRRSGIKCYVRMQKFVISNALKFKNNEVPHNTALALRAQLQLRSSILGIHTSDYESKVILDICRSCSWKVMTSPSNRYFMFAIVT